MSDIYIVYAKEDFAITEKLHGLLSKQWNTWWDADIVGEWHRVIEEEISNARCIVPLFSAYSRQKATVIDELNIGKSLGKKIIPIKLDDSKAPYSFGTLSSVDMRGWSGEEDHAGFRLLQQRIKKIIPPRKKPQRPAAIADGRLLLPALFLSVSSYNTQLKPPDAAVRALRVFKAPNILVSAYDLVARRKPEAMINEIKEYSNNGGFVLVDSGNYEKSRLGTRRWKPGDLKEVLAQIPHDWALCFDVMLPKHNPKHAIDEIVSAIERDQLFTASPVIPIVHAPEYKRGGHKLEFIPTIFREIAERLAPPLIAIPERELGPGLIARARTVRNIRKELSKLPFYQPIHILGTGNPWAIPILAAAGADTFDGLEWCRMAVDRDTHRLHHFQHFDFFKYQNGQAESLITRAAFEDNDIDFAGKVVFHNLDYYTGFMRDMREYFNENNIEAFMVAIMGSHATKQLKQQIPDIFK